MGWWSGCGSCEASAQEWAERSIAVTRFVAGLNDGTRVFCRGEVHTEKGYWPAALTYRPTYKQCLAWAPSGKKGAMEAHHVGLFHSGIPHVGIAREVLDGPETIAALRNKGSENG